MNLSIFLNCFSLYLSVNCILICHFNLLFHLDGSETIKQFPKYCNGKKQSFAEHDERSDPRAAVRLNGTLFEQCP